jgi:hypothetical protein
MDYPSGFACIVLSQKTHKDTRWSCYMGTWWLCVRRLFLLKQQPRHFFLNKYNVSLEKAQYLYWITRRHRFAVASTVSTDVLYDQRSVTFHPRYLMLRLFKIILHLWYCTLNQILILQTCRMCVNSLKQICMFVFALNC